MGESRRAQVYSADLLFIAAELRADGTLVILGHDLNRSNLWGAEYEYDLTVAPADVPRVVAALGGAAGGDVLALLKANWPEIMRHGERRWLEGLGIEPGFWSRIGD
jgi:hypothetical protein